MLRQVLGSGTHLLSLINDILDMSKIESGTLALLVQEQVDVTALLHEAIVISKPALAGKPIELHTNIPADLPLLRADKQRLYQVFVNIIGNACKFTKQGRIEVRAAAEGEMLRVAVADTGPGIAPADHALVFEAFKQSESGIRQGGGTGLGLPISKNLVELHGGHIRLESQLGHGATFIVELPVKSDQLVPMLSAP